MRNKLFLSTLIIVIVTLLLSSFSIILVIRDQFSHYLTKNAQTTLAQWPERLSNLYLTKGSWDIPSLESVSHYLPMDTQITLTDSNGNIIHTLKNPMQDMMRDGMMGMKMGMNFPVQNWTTKTEPITTPLGTIAFAEFRYPTSARIINPEDVTFMTAIFQSLLVAGAIALLIGTLLTLWTSQRLSYPLRNLTKAVNRVGQGNLDERVHIESNDEVGELASAFNSMAQSLKQQEHLRKQFTVDIAHELRTPLTSMRSYIEAFQDGVLPANNENLQALNEEIHRLVSLVTDLKDLNVAEIGELKPKIGPVDLVYLLDKVILNLRPLIEEKRLSVELDSSNSSLLIDGDEYLLTRLFYNLIHNAYKYSNPEGKIKVSVTNQQENVVINVIDYGIGISQEDIPYIFERFYRTDKSRNRETGGTGIGLALVHQIVKLHKGHIKVQSKQDEGSSFSVTLPIVHQK